MRKYRLKEAVLCAMGSREEMSIDELRSVVFSTYSKPELMRRAAYSSGKKSRAVLAYVEGDSVDEQVKANLVALGIKKTICDLRWHGKAYLLFDKERGTVTRVRK